jgi:hypothetical protein
VFTIGEFSKITGRTIKTLRFYHDQGLLIPTSVDDGTGYRYYDRSKIEAARIITHLLDYVRDKGYAVQVPTREVYHKGPGMIFRGNPKNYLTEVQLLIDESEK